MGLEACTGGMGLEAALGGELIILSWARSHYVKSVVVLRRLKDSA